MTGLDNFPIMEATKSALCVAVMDKQNARDVMALAKSNVPYFTGVCKTPKNVNWTLPQTSPSASPKRPFMLIKFEGNVTMKNLNCNHSARDKDCEAVQIG